MLGVRLVAGQNASGGWTYNCIAAVPPATERFLRSKLGEATLTAGKKPPASKPGNPGVAAPAKPPVMGKLHPDVERYRRGLLAAAFGKQNRFDDNSNTQFGVLGVWTARKHGVPVEPALELIEKRFLRTQTKSGGWPYTGPVEGSPAMTCAGLLGLATAVGRREERLLKAEKPRPPAKKPKPPAGANPNDPFFNPPEPPSKPVEPAKPKPRKPDARDKAVKRGIENVAAALADAGGIKRGLGNIYDPYFLWSMERVGVIYGIDKFGKTDWYAYGADLLIPNQNQDGSWGVPRGYGPDVETAFALLFLARSNLARDLTAKVQRKPVGTELRAGSGPGGERVAAAPAKPAAPMPAVTPPAKPSVSLKPAVQPKPVLKPRPAGTTPSDIAVELFRTAEQTGRLHFNVSAMRGGRNTQARYWPSFLYSMPTAKKRPAARWRCGSAA